MNARVLSSLEQLGHEVNHSPPPSAEVKNEWRYASTPPVGLHGMNRNNFTFTFIYDIWHIFQGK